MKKKDLPITFVVGNEKGGVGKTTCCMHIISVLLHEGLVVSSIDVDGRQKSLTSYLDNRARYNSLNPAKLVPMPTHYVIEEDISTSDISTKEEMELAKFVEIFNHARNVSDVIVVDTPGTCSNLSKIAHSYADVVITPINDSFIDMDVLAKIDQKTLHVIAPSIYSEMVWQQKMERAQRDGESIEWIIVKNRLNSVDTNNKKNIQNVLNELSKKISFKIAPGFNERVIFRELFLSGITLTDLPYANYAKPFTASNIAARQELRDFLSYLNIDAIIDLKNSSRIT